MLSDIELIKTTLDAFILVASNEWKWDDVRLLAKALEAAKRLERVLGSG